MSNVPTLISPTEWPSGVPPMAVWLDLSHTEEKRPFYTPARAIRHLALLKKQTGGIGLFGQLTFVLEPLPETSLILVENGAGPERLPVEYWPAVVEGVWRAAAKSTDENGRLVTVIGFRLLIIDATHHLVDSNTRSFMLTAANGLRTALTQTSLRRWKGAPTHTPPVLRSPSLSERAETFRHQFTQLVETVTAYCETAVLIPHAFTLVMPGVYVQRVNDLLHVLSFSARWHADLRIQLKVIDPQTAELLTGHTAVEAWIDSFYGSLMARSLDDLLPGPPEWSFDLAANPTQTAAAIAHDLARYGLMFLESWGSKTAVLAKAEAGEFTLGSERTAALLHSNGQTAAAITLLNAEITRLQPDPHHTYFVNRLVTLKQKIEQASA